MGGDKVPNHVAIIMDGNGRWAKRRGLPRKFGHRAGVKTVNKTVLAAKRLGIAMLTIYAFSTENWSRPNEEVSGLFKLIGEYFNNSRKQFIEEGIRVRVVGERDGLDDKLLAQIENIQAATENGKNLTLNICFNYGARREIVSAVRRISERGEQMTEENLLANLYTTAPDLIIRTGGEKRLSNFMLYQAAYSELYFTDVYWPDFTEAELIAAVKEYAGRTRRYGKI